MMGNIEIVSPAQYINGIDERGTARPFLGFARLHDQK